MRAPSRSRTLDGLLGRLAPGAWRWPRPPRRPLLGDPLDVHLAVVRVLGRHLRRFGRPRRAGRADAGARRRLVRCQRRCRPRPHGWPAPPGVGEDVEGLLEGLEFVGAEDHRRRRPLGVSTTRSWRRSTPSTISDRRFLISASGSTTSAMTRNIVIPPGSAVAGCSGRCSRPIRGAGGSSTVATPPIEHLQR